MARQLNEEARAASKTKAIVAKGRTVYVGRKPVHAGDEIELATDEAAWLRSNGFLVDPEATPIPVGDGPNFGSSEGPTVKGLA
jgi:hypothetical protein